MVISVTFKLLASDYNIAVSRANFHRVSIRYHRGYSCNLGLVKSNTSVLTARNTLAIIKRAT